MRKSAPTGHEDSVIKVTKMAREIRIGMFVMLVFVFLFTQVNFLHDTCIINFAKQC